MLCLACVTSSGLLYFDEKGAIGKSTVSDRCNLNTVIHTDSFCME